MCFDKLSQHASNYNVSKVLLALVKIENEDEDEDEIEMKVR